VSTSRERRSEILFAVGNLVPAIVLGVGLYALPVRWWPADIVIGSAVIAVPVTSAVAFGRPLASRKALRVGAGVLLAIGFVLLAAALLSVAFLSGIHGDFGQGGMTLMALIAFLVLPYAIVYPVLELRWVGPAAKKPAKAAESAPAPVAAQAPNADESAPPSPAASNADGGAPSKGDGGAAA
jgi:hypothetical protein